MAIINAPGNGFDVLLESLLRKEQLAQQKEDLRIRQGDFKLRQEASMRERELQKAMLQGATAAAALFSQTNPQFKATAATLPPAALPSFVEAFQGFAGTEAQTRGVAAAATTGEVGARVAQATEGAQVEVGNLQPTLTRAQLTETQARTTGLMADTERVEAVTRGQNLNNVYQAMTNDLGPEFVGRLNGARALFETGAITWGQARQVAALPKTDLIPDNTVFVRPGGSDANAEAMKNQSFAAMMQTADGIINQLNAEGVRLAFLPALQRSSQNATWDAVINLVAGSDQERMVNAQRMFGDAYRFSLSGQQSSDREAVRMLNSVAEQVGDSEATIAQKRALRQVMINVTQAKAGGGMTAVQAAQMGYRAAQNTKNPETVALFREILDAAVANEAGTGVSNAPTDGENLGGRLDRVNGLIDRGLGGLNR